MRLLLAACVVCLTAVLSAQGKSYDKYEVIRITPHTAEQVKLLYKLKKENDRLDFWKEPVAVGRNVDINLHPRQADGVKTYLRSHDIQYDVMIEDVQTLIDSITSENKGSNVSLSSPADIDYTKYNTLDDVDKWLDELASEYSSIARLVTVGKTYEGRTLRAVHIFGNARNNSKPGFWMDGGIHSREWISPATVIYILGHLLSGYGNEQAVTRLINAMDVYVLPVFNADGYVYTWESDRLWRKTREPNTGSSCIGTDPNRNWDWHWGESGASRNPCAEDYAGSAAFTQISIKDVADYLLTIPDLQVYINFHSYSQLWMYPWAYAREDTPDYADQRGAAIAAVDALKAVHGIVYEEGSIAKIIYVASGSTADWTYGAAKVKYSYGVELRDKGRYGFLLPPTEILPSGEETLAAILALGDYVIEHK